MPAPGSIGDPTSGGASGGGATVTVYNAATGEAFTANLPAEKWKGGKGSRYSFRDPGGPIQRLSVAADKLVVRGGRSGFGYTLDKPPQGTVSVQVRLGTASPWCADVPAKASGKPPTTTKNDRVDRFLGQPNTAPPVECPIYGSASGAFLDTAQAASDPQSHVSSPGAGPSTRERVPCVRHARVGIGRRRQQAISPVER